MLSLLWVGLTHAQTWPNGWVSFVHHQFERTMTMIAIAKHSCKNYNCTTYYYHYYYYYVLGKG